MEDREQHIREHAQRIWEEEGRPEGSHEDHWRRAEELYDASDKPQAAQEPEENWKVEAGITDQAHPPVMPTVIPPD